MYLLYLDESGNESDEKDRHFVLGGLAVFERQTYFLSGKVESIQTRHFPGLQPIEFHASSIRAGKDFWRAVEREKRGVILDDLTQAIQDSNQEGVALFAAVVEKTRDTYGERAVECATEEVRRRFDLFLSRRHYGGDSQRGLIIFSEGKYDKRARIWVRKFRELGTQWGTLKNLSDIPYFASVKENRLLQLADIVSHSIFLLYERHDNSLARNFISRFDQSGGILHGLVHRRADRAQACDCPACTSRNAPGDLGPWL
jgi:hypothetical protein